MSRTPPFLLDDSVFPVPYCAANAPPPAQMIPDAIAFVSGRLREMRGDREVAAAICGRLGIAPLAWEERLGGAQPRPPADAYLDGVRQSDIFIGLYGLETSAAVEDEYHEARKEGVDVLAFVQDVAAGETRSPEMERFLCELRTAQPVTYVTYQDATALEVELVKSLFMLIDRRGRLWLKLSHVVISPERLTDDGDSVVAEGYTHSREVQSALRRMHDSGETVAVTALSSGEARLGRITGLHISQSTRFRCDYSLRAELVARCPREPYSPRLWTTAVCQTADGMFDLAVKDGSWATVSGIDCLRQGVLLTLCTDKGEVFFNRAFGGNFRRLMSSDSLDEWKLRLLLHIDAIETLTMPIEQASLGRVAPAQPQVERVLTFEITELDREAGSCLAAVCLEVNGLPERLDLRLPLRRMRLPRIARTSGGS